MDDEWHVVQRKKKELRPSIPPKPLFPKKELKQHNTKHDFSKSKHNIENNLRPVEYKDDIVNDNIVNNNIVVNKNVDGDGSDIILAYEYVLWVHSVQNTDWSINGYKKLCSIKTVSDFWKLFNNIGKLNFKNNNFFLMKKDITPIWEDENNRGGGICSLRVEMDQALKVYESLCVFLMCEKLVDNVADINGISITPKNNWSIIKIWNRDKKNKIDRLLNKSILDKYKNVSIMYKENQPEY